MEIRRTTYGAAIRLACVLSAVAAVLALGWEALGDVSATPLVLAVIITGFVTSWVTTGRASRTAARPVAHRVAVVPLRHPVG